MFIADDVRQVCKDKFEIEAGVGKFHDVSRLWLKAIPDELWQFQRFEKQHDCDQKACSCGGDCVALFGRVVLMHLG